MSRKQVTIRDEVVLEGVGLHNGKPVRLKFKPAAPNAGAVFVRTDLPGRPGVQATIGNLVKRLRRTSLGRGEVEVQTVEHLLATFMGLGIDNIIVEIDAEEIPAVDGSAMPFVEALKSAGRVVQDAERETHRISRVIAVGGGDSSLVAVPGSDGLTISYTLSYPGGIIGTQHVTLEVTEDAFVSQIAPARTFSPESEIDELVTQGLGKGATYQNSLIVGEAGVIQNELRFRDEFARHKILDLLGDLFLLNADLSGSVIGVKSGHSDNAELVAALEREVSRNDAGEPPDEHSIEAIKRILPHRYPFLLVDKIISMEEGKRIVGIKNVTYDELFFQGHFPGRPIMPAVLQVEAMAQVAGVLLLRGPQAGKLPLLMGLDNVKFRKPVVPGDQLMLEAEVVKLKTRSGSVHTRALVDGKVVAEADIKFMVVDPQGWMG